MEPIERLSIKRAKQTFRCLPFNSTFYVDAKSLGLNAKNVFKNKSRYSNPNMNWFSTSDAIEADFRWLITVGILRREVDGQGLTSKIRLTPLGRQILENEANLPEEIPSWSEKISQWLRRKRYLQ